MVNKFGCLLVLALTAAVLTACGDTEKVLFVTTTQIGIDVDTKSQGAVIGYGRYEGLIGPVYESGAAPPVVAGLKSNLQVFNPNIHQIYATGEAARIITGMSKGGNGTTKKMVGEKYVMYFGTGTNIGLKASFSGKAPAFNLGYKRHEYSMIPIGSTTKTKPLPDGSVVKEDTYASVIATLDLDVVNTSFSETGTGLTQFFATGEAAEEVANIPSIKARIIAAAKEGFGVRKIDCSKKGDDASKTIMDWLRKNEKNKNTLKSIIYSDFGGVVTNWEFVFCEDFAAQRLKILKRHDIRS